MKIKLLLCFSGILYSTVGWCTDYLSGEQKSYIHDGLSVSASAGYLGGKAHEKVYYQGRKISQLDWKIKNAAILQAGVNYDVLPWLSLKATGWTTLSSGSGHLDDYDWQNPGSNRYTDSSTSPAKFNEANEFDLSLYGWILNKPDYKAGVVLGYQESRYSWTARNGTYDYSGTDASGNYDPDAPRDRGKFPANKPVVGYKQTFSTPYVGIAGKYAFDNVELTGLVKYSHWAEAKDYDNHYLNSTTTNTRTGSTEWWYGEVNAGYWVTPRTKLFTQAAYIYYPERRGDITQWSRDGREFLSKGGSMENQNWTLTAGVEYLW